MLGPAADGLIIVSRAMHEDYAVRREPHTLAVDSLPVSAGKAEAT
jgi:hypothetical protein